jgi:hypothetical protein
VSCEAVNRRPHLSIIAPDASSEEAAAVIAALERFMRDTAPPVVQDPAPVLSAWKREALLEAVDRAPERASRWS